MNAKFNQTYEWRIEALDQTGQYPQLEREAQALVAHDAANPAHNDYIKEIGLDFWKNAQARQAAGDQNGYVQNARLTAIIYEYFARMVSEGKIPAKNLTGTLSILGQAYLAMGDVDKAQATFSQVAAADAGIARRQRRAGAHRAIETGLQGCDRSMEPGRSRSRRSPIRCSTKRSTAWPRSSRIRVTSPSACNKLTVTRSEHPNLGSPGMKAQWGELQHKLCENHTEG